MVEVNMFGVPEMCFKVIGFWRRSNHFRLLRIAQIFVLVNMSFGMFSESLFIPRNTDDVMAAAEASGPVVISFIAICKGILLSASLDKFYAFMDKIKGLASGNNKV